MVVRRVRVVAGVVVVVLVALAGLAWACTIQVRTILLTPVSGPVGSQVAVTGEAVVPGAAVELRWDALDGPVVATAVTDGGGAFTAQVTVPDVAPGVYSLVVAADGVGVGRSAFEVSPSAGQVSAAPATEWSRAGVTQQVIAASDRGVQLPLVAGVVLLGVGTAAMLAGFTVAVAARRRPVRAQR